MLIERLDQIVEEARKRGRRRMAVAYGQDSHTLEAVYAAYQEGLVEPTLYGDKAVIEEICAAEGLDVSVFKIIDESSDVKCVRMAVAAVVAGDADVLMKGLVSTDKYMRGILNKEAGLFPPRGVLSHVSIIEMPSSYPRLLTISDVAVLPLPDFKQKMVQIGYLAQTAKLLGVKTPKIACIAPSEQVLLNVTSSTDGALLSKMADRGQLGDVIVDGPLSLDVALFKEVADHKKVKGSSIAGVPDCLLFPNLESANVFFKSASHLCGGELAAMVMGTKVPCVLTSRGDSSKTKLYSIALACLAVKS
ncbi:MAG: phosphate acyltransferase [Rikenellaceae bacterium]